jgi:hypothetical protein
MVRRVCGGAVADIAALPVQEQKRSLWRKLNALKPDRSMVMIDPVCWNEMNVDGELTLRCENAECRGYETELRRRLRTWWPADRRGFQRRALAPRI